MFAPAQSLRELVYLAVEAAAGAAAFQNFRDSRDDSSLDATDFLGTSTPLGEAEHRVGSPLWRSQAFFKSLSAEDVHALAVLYWTARDHDLDRTDDIQRQSLLKDMMDSVTRSKKGDPAKTRETCVRKLTEVMGDNIVYELTGALSSGLVETAEAMRAEFRVFQRS